MFDTLQYNLVSITGKLRVRCNSQYCINMSFIATPSICHIQYMTVVFNYHYVSLIIHISIWQLSPLIIYMTVEFSHHMRSIWQLSCVWYQITALIIRMYMITFIVSRPNATHSRKGGRVSRDALLVIHIPLLHFSFYPKIPQRNDTSPFWKSTFPTSGVTLTILFGR